MTSRLKEWRNEPVECNTQIPRPQRPIAVEDDQTRDESSYSVSPPGHTGGICSLRPEKAEALADSLETQFQPVTNPSVPAVTEVVNVALRSNLLTPASERKLTTPDKVHEAIRGLKFSKALVPDGIPNRALMHLPQRAVSLLA